MNGPRICSLCALSFSAISGAYSADFDRGTPNEKHLHDLRPALRDGSPLDPASIALKPNEVQMIQRDDIQTIRALDRHIRAQGFSKKRANAAAMVVSVRSFVRSLPFTQRLRLLFGRREKS